MILTRIEKEPRSGSHEDDGERSHPRGLHVTREALLPGVPVSGDLRSELERLERRLGPLHNCLLIDGMLLIGSIAHALN
jgi:hypothetical protein